MQIIWDGDEVAWRGLINNYLICLERRFTLYRLVASIEELMDIQVFKINDDLQIKVYGNLYEEF